MMNPEKYTKRPGDFEIRILADGRLVFIGPDEDILSLTKLFNPLYGIKESKLEVKEDERTEAEESDSSS